MHKKESWFQADRHTNQVWYSLKSTLGCVAGFGQSVLHETLIS